MRFGTSLQFVMRLFLAGVFAYAAITKALDPPSSTKNLTIFSSLSSKSIVRSTIIGAESFLAFWLIFGKRTVAASAITIASLSAFTGIVLLELTKSYPKPCGCMGSPKTLMDVLAIRRSLYIDLTRNLLLLITACSLYFLPGSSRCASISESDVCMDPEHAKR